MVTATRITPHETFQKVQSGKALLVCAYDSDGQFKSLQLDGAISFSEFRTKPSIPPQGSGNRLLLCLKQ